VFDDILNQVDADYVWDKNLPTGVSWAMHRLSVVQTVIAAYNGIRKNISRSEGNVLVAGSEMINNLESLADDIYKPESYGGDTPIGPYVSGTLIGKIKVIKNQDYPANKSVMVYKKSDIDASMMGGVFIGLYQTPELVLPDLMAVSGLGSKFGYVKTLDNSIVSLTVTG
jgi:hypothetical protein